MVVIPKSRYEYRPTTIWTDDLLQMKSHWEHQCIKKKVKEAIYDEDFGVYDEDDQNREREREREYGTKVRCTVEV